MRGSYEMKWRASIHNRVTRVLSGLPLRRLFIVSLVILIALTVWGTQGLSWRNGQRAVNPRTAQGYIGVFIVLAALLAVALSGVHIQVSELQKREAFLRTIYNHIDVAIFVVDVAEDGTYTYVGFNPRHEHIFGVDADWVVGKKPQDLLTMYPQEVVEESTALYDACVANRDRVQIEQRAVVAGEARWWLTAVTPLLDQARRVYRLVGTSLEITARKRVEDEVRDLAKFPEENPNPVLRVTPDGTILYANPASQKLLDAWTVCDGVTFPEDVQLLVRDVLELEIHQRLEIQCGQRIIALLFSPVVEAGYVNVYGQDITERKRTNAALRESERQLRELTDLLPQTVFELNLEGQVTFLNHTGYKVFGIQPSEVEQGFDALQIIVPEDHERASHNLQRIFRGEDTVSIHEYWVQKRDATRFPALIYAAPITSDIEPASEPRIVGTRGIIVDITASKRAEEERRLLFDLSMDMLCVAGFDGYLKQVNPAWETTLGWTETELLSKPWLAFVHPDDRAKSIRTGEQLAAGKSARDFQNRYLCRDGGYRWIAWNSYPLLDQQVIFGVARDITRQKRAADALRQAKEAAEAANRTKTAFLASMSHELRTPLNIVLGFTRLMLSEPHLTSEQRDRLETIAHSGEHLLVLINEILDLTKIEAGRIESEGETVDLYGMLEGVQEMFRVQADRKNLKVCFDVSPDLPRYIRTDAGKLRQVLINLLSNAVKFTEQGEIIVRVTLKENDA